MGLIPEDLIEEARALRKAHPDGCGIPNCRPEDIESVLRVDTLRNEGEGEVCEVKIQLRVRDRSGVKPYLVLDASVHPLSGRFRVEMRDDRRNLGASSFGRNHLTDDPSVGTLMDGLLIRCAIEAAHEAGYRDEAAIARSVFDDGWRPHGWPKLNRRFPALAELWNGAPSWDDPVLKAPGALEPGRWYCVAEAVPAGFISMTIGKVSDDSESPPKWDGIGYGSFHARCESGVETIRMPMYRNGNGLGTPTLETDRSLFLMPSGRDGRIFWVPEALAEGLKAFADPRFDRSVEVRPEMPVWDKSLDTVENCVERVKTERYGFDRGQYREALTWLVRHRDRLTEKLDIHTTSRWEGASDEEIARWREIHEGSLETCGCGACRAIIPGSWRTEFVPSSEGPVTLERGRTYEVRTPDGADVRYRLWVEGGCLKLVYKPLLDRRGEPGAIDLWRVGYSVERDEGRELRTLTRPIARFEGADTGVGTVTIVPDEAYVIVETDRVSAN